MSPRTLHRIAFSDPESTGELTTRFAVEGDGTRVTLELEYRLASGGPLAWVTDRVFVRSQMRESLRRTLARYRLEVEDLAGSAATRHARRRSRGRGGSCPVASRALLPTPRIRRI